MFVWSAATRIYLALGATDLRQGFDGLYALVEQRLELDPLNGHVFVFANRRRSRIKLLFWDSSGLWLCSKRLEREAGVEIHRATLDGWVMRVGELLVPVVAAMRQELLAGGYIQADETPVAVQMHGGADA